jgi:hypothetical protein
MQLVRGYYQPTGGKLIANEPGINIFSLGDKFNFIGNSRGSCNL